VDENMNRYELVFAALTAAVVLVNICDASVVSMDTGYTWSGWLPDGDAHTYTWDFDYDLQLLTVQETILVLRPNAGWSLSIGGRVDSDSVFSVVRTITNQTGVTWTAYQMTAPPPPAGPSDVRATIVYETIEFTKFETVEHGHPLLEFSGPPFVMDGESFTMSFDMHARYDSSSDGRFSGGYGIYIIPEPATVLLLGLGVLVLRKRPRSTSAIIISKVNKE
jgi:hypothetical protein